jgi:hypothetical protein
MLYDSAMCSLRTHALALALALAAGAVQAQPADWPKTLGVKTCGMVVVPDSGPEEAVHELSGLAGDASRLFAVSDQGWLVVLRPRFQEGILRSVTVERVTELADVDGKPLPGPERDAEGLDLVTVTAAAEGAAAGEELWISFEREPRIERFGLDGRRLGKVAISSRVTAPSNFASPNKAFEALAIVGGRPLTAPERPSRKAAGWVPLLGPDGRIARFPLADVKDSSLVGLDLVRGRTVIALERAFHRGSRRTVITVSKFDLPAKRARKVKKRTLMTLDTQAGFTGIDNFEGVLALKDGRVLLVSDDNESAVQRQLLLCLDFEKL